MATFPIFDQLAAEDLRTIVPAVDHHGGVLIYRQGRLTHYGMNGEWFEAVPVPDAVGVQRSRTGLLNGPDPRTLANEKEPRDVGRGSEASG